MALKVPPALQVIICLLLIWLLGKLLPVVNMDVHIRNLLAVTLGGLALAIVVAGINSFRLAGTTVDPRSPQKATALVTNGIYRLTRNPMYLALVLMLAGYCIYLGTVAGLFVVAGFIHYMTTFQIKPEEEALERQFGEAYRDYKARVRRWI